MAVWTLVTLGSIASVKWPEVQPFIARIPVRLSAERIAIDIPIRNRSGEIVYVLACRGGNDTYIESLPGNWVQPLMCTLAEGTQASDVSLLSEDDSAAWFSRGQFRSEELLGDCGRYPEFGVHRSFRLRGFQLAFDAQNIVTNVGGDVDTFTLQISLTRDPTATAAKASRPGFLDPRGTHGNCRVVRRGSETRMCRDANFSWVPCSD